MGATKYVRFSFVSSKHLMECKLNPVILFDEAETRVDFGENSIKKILFFRFSGHEGIEKKEQFF